MAAGTYTTYDAPGNGTGYATEKLALAALLGVTPTASNVPVHCITVMRVGATFVGATTPLNTVGLTVNYYPIASCGLTNPYQGLWPYAGSVSSQGGMTLGVEPDININLDTLIWEAHS